MEFIDKETVRSLTGIYQIKNIVNGFSYIGQTKENFGRRYLLHRWKLNHHSHDNINLQKDWDIYGSDSFEFSVLEIAYENLDELERKWILQQRLDKKCYNIQDGGRVALVDYVTSEGRKITGIKNRERMTGKKLSQETRKKMSEAHKGKIFKKRTNKLTSDDAYRIKSMLVNGHSTGEICDVLHVQYKLVNNILSNDAWKSVIVDGWDEFQRCRKHARGHPVAGRYKIQNK